MEYFNQDLSKNSLLSKSFPHFVWKNY